MSYSPEQFFYEVQEISWVGNFKHPLTEQLLLLTTEKCKKYLSTENIEKIEYPLTKKQKKIVAIILRKIKH